MKIRQSFVSNSSSSSFCILGFQVTNSIKNKIYELSNKNLKNKYEKKWGCPKCKINFLLRKPSFCEVCGSKMEFINCPVVKDVGIATICLDLGLLYYHSVDYGPVVGLDILNHNLNDIVLFHDKLVKMFEGVEPCNPIFIGGEYEY